MSTTLENLQLRVVKLEQEIATLKQRLEGEPPAETPANRGQRLLDQAQRSKPFQKAAAAQAFAQMGIDQSPVPPEQLRQMMAASGIRPEDNLLSRGIQELREE